jgi:hypothetical protein
MAFSSEDIQDLAVLQQLSAHITSVLDREASIADADRQLTETNITKLNTTYSAVLDSIDAILSPA